MRWRRTGGSGWPQAAPTAGTRCSPETSRSATSASPTSKLARPIPTRVSPPAVAPQRPGGAGPDSEEGLLASVEAAGPFRYQVDVFGRPDPARPARRSQVFGEGVEPLGVQRFGVGVVEVDQRAGRGGRDLLDGFDGAFGHRRVGGDRAGGSLRLDPGQSRTGSGCTRGSAATHRAQTPPRRLAALHPRAEPIHSHDRRTNPTDPINRPPKPRHQDEADTLYQILQGFGTVGYHKHGPGQTAIQSFERRRLVVRERSHYQATADVAFSLRLTDCQFRVAGTDIIVALPLTSECRSH